MLQGCIGLEGCAEYIIVCNIHHQELAWITCADKETVVSFVQRYRGRLLGLLGSGPGSKQVVTVAIVDLYFTFSSYVYIEAWP